MSSSHGFLTATDYYRYLQCPHWPYWQRFGDPKDRRDLTDAEEARNADGLQHEKRIVSEQYATMREVKVKDPEEGFKKTVALMKEGAPAIYQGWLMAGERVGRPDILEKRPGKSVFGAWHYAPVDVKRAHELKKEHKMQLAFYSALLEEVQGRYPLEAAVINGDGVRIPFDPSEVTKEFRELTEKLERIRGGEMPEPVYRKSCEDTSPWGKACFRLASERNDIALLFNVDVRRLEGLRSVGVRTVDDAAEMAPEKLEGQAPGLTFRGLVAAKRQAQSLRDHTVIIKRPLAIETKGLEIHFDIESHPPTDTDYLYGFYIREGAGHYQSFVAEKPEDEGKMWRAFLAWLPMLPADYTVYHYANYEVQRLGNLAERYGDAANPWLQKFQRQLVDLKEITRDHVVFPLYFYSLKQICKFLGYAWTGDVTSGGQSISEYEKWLSTKDRKVLDAIIQYNEDDVRATAVLSDWLKEYAGEEKTFAEPYPWKGR